MKAYTYLVFGCILCLTRSASTQNSPSPSSLPILPSRFTMTFELKQQDVSTEAMRQFLKQYEHDSHTQLVHEGRITSQQAEAHDKGVTEAFGQRASDRKARVTFSGNDKRLLYSEEDDDGKRVLLYTGQITLVASQSTGSRGSSVRLWPGFAGFASQVLPFPGAGTLAIPLIQPTATSRGSESSKIMGESPTFHRGYAADLSFQDSQAECLSTDAGLQMKSCVLSDKDNHVEQRWDFSQPKRLAGLWIAGEIRFTDFQTYYIGEQQHRDPDDAFTFTLDSAKEESLPDRCFEVENWLHDGDSVQDYRPEGKQVAFIYHKKRGSLEEQEERAQLEEARILAEIANGRIKSTALSGVCALAALSCFGGYWVKLRRRAR